MKDREKVFGIVSLPAAGVQNGVAWAGVGQGQIAQRLPQRGVPTAIQKSGAGGSHLPVIPRAPQECFLLAGSRWTYPDPGHVIAVAAGTAVDIPFPCQRGGTDGADEQTHGLSPFSKTAFPNGPRARLPYGRRGWHQRWNMIFSLLNIRVKPHTPMAVYTRLEATAMSR